jgi:hypothetical protein
VGARDLETRQMLKSRGVPSYFSGCLTLTLEPKPGVARDDYIAAVDLPVQVRDKLRKLTDRPVKTITHLDASGSFEQRMQRAEGLLDTYQRAHYVITSRLHCALPCLALGTPVLLIDTAEDRYRFSGLHQLLRHCSPQHFLRGATGAHIEMPTGNQLDYLRFRSSLIDCVSSFLEKVSRSPRAPKFSDAQIQRMRYNTLWARQAELNQLLAAKSAEIEQLKQRLREREERLAALAS